MKLTQEEYNKVLEWQIRGFDFVRLAIDGTAMLSMWVDVVAEHHSGFRFRQEMANHFRGKMSIYQLLQLGVEGVENKEPDKPESDVERLNRIKWQTPYNRFIIKSVSSGAMTQSYVEYVVPKSDWEFLLRQAQRLQDLNQIITEVTNPNYRVPKYDGICTDLESFE